LKLHRFVVQLKPFLIDAKTDGLARKETVHLIKAGKVEITAVKDIEDNDNMMRIDIQCRICKELVLPKITKKCSDRVSFLDCAISCPKCGTHLGMFYARNKNYLETGIFWMNDAVGMISKTMDELKTLNLKLGEDKNKD